MIKNIKLFVNNNEQSLANAKVIREKFISHGYTVVDGDDFELAVAVGGDGSFLRMIKANQFNSNIYYVGVNSGTLGFSQEVKMEDLDAFISELRERKYKISDVGIQETIIEHSSGDDSFYSINEIIIRDPKLKLLRMDVMIDEKLLENFGGDGLLICTPFGSTAHNLSYGGSIVYDSLPSLQITPIGGIPSKVYHSLHRSIIIPDKSIIRLTPTIIKEEQRMNKDLLLTIDGDDKKYKGVQNIYTTLNDKKVKCLRFSHYSYPEKINDKFL